MRNEVSKIVEKYSLEFTELCTNYINKSVDIEYIYIYISIEWTGFFNVYFKGNNLTVKKNKVDTLSKIQIDVSENAQTIFNEMGNNLLKLLKTELITKKLNIPNQIKIIYNNNSKLYDLDISFEKYLDENIMIGEADYSEKWFAELGGVLRPNALIRMKKLFGEDFLEKNNS